jgi:hypothetical protein
VWHALLRDTRFFALLTRLDQDLAEQTRTQGCPCGGRLHRAHYPRKPRGGPADLSLVTAMDADGAGRRLPCAFWDAACTSAPSWSW